MNWWMDVTNSVYGGGVFCALIMIGLNFFIIVGTNLAGSRLAWSMARDRAFPFSDYFAHVSTRFHIPLRTMIAILCIDLVIGESSLRPVSGDEACADMRRDRLDCARQRPGL